MALRRRDAGDFAVGQLRIHKVAENGELVERLVRQTTIMGAHNGRRVESRGGDLLRWHREVRVLLLLSNTTSQLLRSVLQNARDASVLDGIRDDVWLLLRRHDVPTLFPHVLPHVVGSDGRAFIMRIRCCNSRRRRPRHLGFDRWEVRQRRRERSGVHPRTLDRKAGRVRTIVWEFGQRLRLLPALSEHREEVVEVHGRVAPPA